MKKIFALVILSFLYIHGFSAIFPSQMPDDFKIMYTLGGGTRGYQRTIEINQAFCKDDNHEFYYQPVIRYQVKKESLETLYTALKNLNAFKLQYEILESYDSWGTTLAYTINNEVYYVASMNDAVIIPEHQEAFDQSVQLILDFTGQCRKYNLDHGINLLSEEIPDPMPDDFSIYYYHTYSEDGYTSILLNTESCYYQHSTNGVNSNSKTLKIGNRHLLEKLYHQLKKLQAFTLWRSEVDLYNFNGNGPAINYTINSKIYQQSLATLVDDHKETFNLALKLIFDFVEKRINK